MYSFCPHCGQDISQDQAPGKALVCRYCGKTIGHVTAARPEAVDQAAAQIASGAAARCPHCKQVVQTKLSGGARAFVPHQGTSEPRKMCPGSGKPAPASAAAPAPRAAPAPAPPAAAAAAPIQRPPTSKDLSKYITRDLIRVITCSRSGELKIEELTLEYLDKADRVRLQIDALRDILGPGFRVGAYPPQLGRPHLAVWGNDTLCVIAQKHPQGGYQPMSDAEMTAVLTEVRDQRAAFFR